MNRGIAALAIVLIVVLTPASAAACKIGIGHPITRATRAAFYTGVVRPRDRWIDARFQHGHRDIPDEPAIKSWSGSLMGGR